MSGLKSWWIQGGKDQRFDGSNEGKPDLSFDGSDDGIPVGS